MHNIVQPFSLAGPGSCSRSPREEGETEEEGRGIGGNIFAGFNTCPSILLEWMSTGMS